MGFTGAAGNRAQPGWNPEAVLAEAAPQTGSKSVRAPVKMILALVASAPRADGKQSLPHE